MDMLDFRFKALVSVMTFAVLALIINGISKPVTIEESYNKAIRGCQVERKEDKWKCMERVNEFYNHLLKEGTKEIHDPAHV